MPDKTLNQQLIIEESILSILSDEAQIIRCLRVFFCKTLQELETEKCMIPERKVRLASELINATAQKEKALAEVLEAISLFEIEPDEWIPLAPGESYPLPSEPSEISRIEFEAKTDVGTTSVIELIVSGFPIESEGITENQESVDWELATTYSVDLLSLTNTGTSPIYIRNLTTE